MNIDTTLKFMNHWGDAPSVERLKTSHKSIDVQKSEAENSLRLMALRFQQSPTQSTLKLWATDMVDAGYQDWMIAEVCKSAPFKFERHPTLNQLMEQLTHYKPKVTVSRDELSDLTDRTFAHLKAKFIKQAGVDVFDNMVDFYVKHGCPAISIFNRHYHEMCMLGDWARTYFGDGKKIIDMATKSNEAQKVGNYEHFTSVLRRYAAENRL
jgi:hypothetical protein